MAKSLSMFSPPQYGGRAAATSRQKPLRLMNNIQEPNGVAGSAGFGTITSALDPRVGQLAVKVLF
jgi:hypothetical protein